MWNVFKNRGKEKLTSVDILLELGGHSTPRIVELEEQPDPEKVRVLLDRLRDVHLGFVAQNVSSYLLES